MTIDLNNNNSIFAEEPKRFNRQMGSTIVQYYGISQNVGKVDVFIGLSTKILYKWLNRRSQRKSFDWDKFNMFMKKNPLEKARVIHALF